MGGELWIESRGSCENAEGVRLLDFSSWEYDHESDVVDPLGSIMDWVQEMLDASSVGYDECCLVRTVKRELRLENAEPVGRRAQRRWLMSALTGHHSLLLILGRRALPFQRAFVPMVMEQAPLGVAMHQAEPWNVPAQATPTLIAHFERAGGGVIFGHDGQYMLRAELDEEKP